MKKNTKLKVLFTWNAKWDTQLPEGVEFCQIPLTQTQSLSCSHLMTDLHENFADKACSLLFFSKAGVKGFLDNIGDIDISPKWTLSTVGPNTKKDLLTAGYEVLYSGCSDGLDMLENLLKKQRSEQYLLFMGDLGGEAVEQCLKDNDLNYQRYEVYSNSEPDGAQKAIDEVLSDIDLICLASPSAAERLLSHRDIENLPPLLSIGAATSKKIVEYGAKVYWQADQPGYHSFVDGISKYLTK